MNWIIDNSFDVISNAIAGISMLVAIIFGARSARSASASLNHEKRALEHSQQSLGHERRALEHSEQSLEHTRETLKNERMSVILAYTESVREWGDEVMAALSDGIVLCELDPEKMPDFFQQRNQLRIELMRLIDTGRWYFPNNDENDYGQWKEGAYQGLTQNALTELKLALDLVKALNYKVASENGAKREEMVSIKRAICTEIQNAINPRQFSDFLGMSESKLDVTSNT